MPFSFILLFRAILILFDLLLSLDRVAHTFKNILQYLAFLTYYRVRGRTILQFVFCINLRDKGSLEIFNDIIKKFQVLRTI